MGKSRIRLLAHAAGPEFSLQPGTEIEIDSEVADRLIAGGYAALVEAEPEPEPEPAPKPVAKIERAVVAPSEDAASGPSAKKR